jgi:hypothetical protein
LVEFAENHADHGQQVSGWRPHRFCFSVENQRSLRFPFSSAPWPSWLVVLIGALALGAVWGQVCEEDYSAAGAAILGINLGAAGQQ